MAEAKTRKYIDRLPDIVRGLNNRYLSAIRTSPSGVNVHNEIQIFHRRYDHIYRHQNMTPAFRVGDYCRLRIQKTGAFDKSYTANFDDQIYRISAIRKAPPVLMYQLEDLNGERIEGRWYKELLSHVYAEEPP